MAVPKKIGHYSFLVGVLIAFVLALFSPALSNQTTRALLLVLVILGIVVGFINITSKEVTEFLVASIALIVMSSVSSTLVVIDGLVPNLGSLLQAILSYIAVFVAPAALIVALKAIVVLADKE
ncbi:MAG: hypothetical protein R6U32_04090 [Candidatus Woesearchaeota archaeon]